MPYFLGRYDYALDERGRMPLPPRFREGFASGGVLSQGPDQCLRLFTLDRFDEQAQLYVQEPATERSGRQTRRSFFGRSFGVELDGQGRILIPAPLRSYAELESNVVVLGAGEWLEIWNPARFDADVAGAG